MSVTSRPMIFPPSRPKALKPSHPVKLQPSWEAQRGVALMRVLPPPPHVCPVPATASHRRIIPTLGHSWCFQNPFLVNSLTSGIIKLEALDIRMFVHYSSFHPSFCAKASQNNGMYDSRYASHMQVFLLCLFLSHMEPTVAMLFVGFSLVLWFVR